MKNGVAASSIFLQTCHVVESQHIHSFLKFIQYAHRKKNRFRFGIPHS
jgi:hypothetical protein